MFSNPVVILLIVIAIYLAGGIIAVARNRKAKPQRKIVVRELRSGRFIAGTSGDPDDTAFFSLGDTPEEARNKLQRNLK